MINAPNVATDINTVSSKYCLFLILLNAAFKTGNPTKKYVATMMIFKIFDSPKIRRSPIKSKPRYMNLLISTCS